MINHLTSHQAAQRLRDKHGRAITAKTWRAYVRQRTAPAPIDRVGNSLLWHADDVDAWGAGTWQPTLGPGAPFTLILADLGPDIARHAAAARAGNDQDFPGPAEVAAARLHAVADAFATLRDHAHDHADNLTVRLAPHGADLPPELRADDDLRRAMNDIAEALDQVCMEALRRSARIGTPDNT